MTTFAPAKIGFENVLVPVDFTDVSQRAVDYATNIARRHGSEVTLAHVSTPLSPYAQPEVVWFENLSIVQPAEQQLETWGAELRSKGVKAKAAWLTGMIQDEILAAAEKAHSDLIVLGTHGRSGLQRLIFGSDAEGLYRQSKCPILVVGPAAVPAGDQAWNPQDMIFASDLDPASAPLAACAFSLAQEYRSKFTIFHVDDTQGRADKDFTLR